MFEENLSIIYLFMLFVIALEGKIKNPIDKIIGFFSLTFKVKKQSSRILDQLGIEELSNDPNRITFTYKKVNIVLSFTLFLVAMTWILAFSHNLILTLISYGCAFASFYFVNKTTHLLDIALEAEKLYKQKQQVGFKRRSALEGFERFKASANKEALEDLDTSIFSERK
jgi:hypothetical protein